MNIELVEGKRYRVEFIPDGARKEREFVGTYLGVGQGGLLFDLRPDHGTSNINHRLITGWELTDEPHHPPRRVQNA